MIDALPLSLGNLCDSYYATPDTADNHGVRLSPSKVAQESDRAGETNLIEYQSGLIYLYYYVLLGSQQQALTLLSRVLKKFAVV